MAGPVAGDLPPDVGRVGVDGCPGGWLAAGSVGDAWYLAVFDGFASLWGHLDEGATEQILVDVPIGLCEDSVRECDERARDLLGSRWNSVFRTPIREAIQTKREEGADEDRRPEASDRNDEETGCGISVQAWNIADKIAELDTFRSDYDLDLDGRVREGHPELAFMAFNGQPVAYSKTSERGRKLRRSVLDDIGVDLDAVDRAAGGLESVAVDDDDVLDAVVLALAAREDQPLTTVPEHPCENQPRIYFPDEEPAWDAQSYFSG